MHLPCQEVTHEGDVVFACGRRGEVVKTTHTHNTACVWLELTKFGGELSESIHALLVASRRVEQQQAVEILGMQQTLLSKFQLHKSASTIIYSHVERYTYACTCAE